MIQRRQFLGSVAAVCALSGTASRVFAQPDSDTLQWQSRVIETLPLNDAERAPVVTGVALQKSGQLLAIVGDDHQVGIFDMQNGEYTRHLDRHVDWVRAARFSPDGKLLATAGNDRQLLIWDTNNWIGPMLVKKHPEAIIDVAFSSDGQQLATVGFESILRVYETSTGNVAQSFNCSCNDNHAVAFSSNNNYLAVGGRDGNIRVWNLVDNKRIAEFRAHRQRIRSLEFTDTDEILSCGDDQIVRLTNLQQIDQFTALPRQSSKLYDVARLQDGLVATGGSDNQIHIWRLHDKQRVGSLKGHTGTVSCLEVAGSTLVSGSYDTHVRVWSMERQANLNILPARNVSNNGWNRKLN
jgi:WD40 repeat protein